MLTYKNASVEAAQTLLRYTAVRNAAGPVSMRAHSLLLELGYSYRLCRALCTSRVYDDTTADHDQLTAGTLDCFVSQLCLTVVEAESPMASRETRAEPLTVLIAPSGMEGSGDSECMEHTHTTMHPPPPPPTHTHRRQTR